MIPAQAVEAALSALLPESDMELLKGGWWWGNVETILEAAAPHIIATALRKAADELEYGNPINEWLYDRADEIEATK